MGSLDQILQEDCDSSITCDSSVSKEDILGISRIQGHGQVTNISSILPKSVLACW